MTGAGEARMAKGRRAHDLSLAVGVERILNAGLVDSLVSPSAELVVAASYTSTGGVLLTVDKSSSRTQRGREETRGPADS
jgi:hypothetical protein